VLKVLFKKRVILSLFTVLLVLGSVLFAADFDNDPRLNRYLEDLEARGSVPYQMGYVLEDMVRIDIEKTYPPAEYEITGGLEMANAKGFALGEIDILVIRRSDGKAVLIGEAKMWKDQAAALKKAQSQLDRLKRVLKNGEVADFHYAPEPGRVFTLNQFSEPLKYETYGCRGAVKEGFDYEIDVTPAEGRWLCQKLLDRFFQKEGYVDDPKLAEYVEFVKQLKWPSRSAKHTFIACLIHDLQKTYPSDQFKVLQDVHYSDETGANLGHVKLMFRHGGGGGVALVCNAVFGWSNMKNAATIYNRYLCDFQTALADNRIATLEADYPKGVTLEVTEFDGLLRYETFGPKGARQAGFSDELDLTDYQIYYIRYAAFGQF
jgi:hypothetical protein